MLQNLNFQKNFRQTLPSMTHLSTFSGAFRANASLLWNIVDFTPTPHRDTCDCTIDCADGLTEPSVCVCVFSASSDISAVKKKKLL